MDKKYSYLKFFEKIWESEERKYTFASRDKESAELWQKEFRGELWKLLGMPELLRYHTLLSEERPGAKLLETVQCEGYVRQKYELQTLPEVFMPFYVLIPEHAKGGAVIALHGHGADKNTICGAPSTPDEEEKVRKTPKECYAVEFVREGYHVFAPDLPGFGERQEAASGKIGSLGCSCVELSCIAEGFGFSLQGLAVWELMRLVDFAKEWKEIRKIGCAGFSGGGFFTVWLAALDERVEAAVVSGYIHSFGDTILSCHRCACNFLHGIWKLCDISDLCGLIAPRPLYGENGLRDGLNGKRGMDGVLEQVEKIRKIYGVFDSPEKFLHKTPDGKHQWYGECKEFLHEFLS